MDEPETWRWIWLIAAGSFAVGEMLAPGTFFLAPFAIGAAVAAITALAGLDLVIQWLAFVGTSLAAFLALRPLARKVDKIAGTAGVGANRLVGKIGVVIEEIPATEELGLVKVDREEWRAESRDGRPVPVGYRVEVLEVRGTRVIVGPAPPP